MNMHTMKVILVEIFAQVLNLIFALLAIVTEIGECLRDALLTATGYPPPRTRFEVWYVKRFIGTIMRDHRERSMRNLVFFRIFGHVVFLSMHIYHLIGFFVRLRRHLPTTPELQQLDDLFFRYLTTWNLFLQMFYSLLGLACDVSTVFKKDDLVPDWLRNYRHTLFAGLVWPLASVAVSFWPIYLYQKELIAQPCFEVVVTTACNLDWHASILVYAFWELIFLPKQFLLYQNTTALLHIVGYIGVYLITLLYTKYVDLQVWVYPILEELGSILYVIILVALISVQITTAYFLQGRIKEHYWRELGFLKKK